MSKPLRSHSVIVTYLNPQRRSEIWAPKHHQKQTIRDPEIWYPKVTRCSYIVGWTKMDRPKKRRHQYVKVEMPKTWRSTTTGVSYRFDKIESYREISFHSFLFSKWCFMLEFNMLIQGLFVWVYVEVGTQLAWKTHVFIYMKLERIRYNIHWNSWIHGCNPGLTFLGFLRFFREKYLTWKNLHVLCVQHEGFKRDGILVYPKFWYTSTM